MHGVLFLIPIPHLHQFQLAVRCIGGTGVESIGTVHREVESVGIPSRKVSLYSEGSGKIDPFLGIIFAHLYPHKWKIANVIIIIEG